MVNMYDVNKFDQKDTEIASLSVVVFYLYKLIAKLLLFQVRFLAMSTVVEVATQGRATNLETDCCDNWLEDFTVEISSDCITFTQIRDDAGNIVVINVYWRYQVT